MRQPETVLLPPVALVEPTEKAIHDSLREMGTPHPEVLLLDMSQCEYIEVSALVYLLAVLADRVANGLRTRLRLPEHKPTRDFMRVWLMPQAVRSISGCRFFDLVADDSRRFFGENETPEGNTYTRAFHGGALRHLVNERFFALNCIAPQRSSTTHLVAQESARWDEPLIQSVLRTHLDGPASYVGSRIVYESMTNALNHGGASTVVTASKFCASSKHDTSNAGHFTVSFWDDGTSMIETLLEALRAGKEIKSGTAHQEPEEHLLIFADHGGRTRCEQIVSSALVPSIASERHEVLFALTLPGITRDLHRVECDRACAYLPDQSAAGPGMGLPVLLNTAIDVFRGSVAFRTDRYFMNIKRASGSSVAHYRAKIELRDDPDWPPFRGNMVTVRLPLKKTERGQ